MPAAWTPKPAGPHRPPRRESGEDAGPGLIGWGGRGGVGMGRPAGSITSKVPLADIFVSFGPSGVRVVSNQDDLSSSVNPLVSRIFVRELIRTSISSQPPEDCVSTNFTTSACPVAEAGFEPAISSWTCAMNCVVSPKRKAVA